MTRDCVVCSLTGMGCFIGGKGVWLLACLLSVVKLTYQMLNNVKHVLS